MHRKPSKNIIEFRSGDVASFWLLHTASSAFAGLSHLSRHASLHPERLFEKLLELAGALMTFSKTFTLADLPTYDHINPGPGFTRLDQIVRELLETVISTRYFAIALNETQPSFHQGRLDAEQINPQGPMVSGSVEISASRLASLPQFARTSRPRFITAVPTSATAAPQLAGFAGVGQSFSICLA